MMLLYTGSCKHLLRTIMNVIPDTVDGFVKTFHSYTRKLFVGGLETRLAQFVQKTVSMASSRPINSTQVSRVHHFDLVEGMQLQINVSGSSERGNVRIEFQLKNCTRTWVLHWGFIVPGNTNWFIPADNAMGSKPYKTGLLQSQFTKHGQIYLLIIELRDTNIHAIEFVLKDGNYERWFVYNFYIFFL
ncbi:Alpha-glucan water dikinase 2 [Quillaja saponaria]|uniref:Alpha-glucan water dikinase 2 n=1 Tax=Quillaja saponaria TaxID=32244 RepID=A0AAD7PRT6_QUISA|nr:Alpha-glucan water dikinase 2 [Quillaja saponaria]